MNLLKAIGANENMTLDEIKVKWDSSPDTIKSQAPNIGEMITSTLALIGAVTTAIKLLQTAQSAYDAAVRVSNPINTAPAIAGTLLDTAKAEASNQINSVASSSNAVVTAMKNIEVK